MFTEITATLLGVLIGALITHRFALRLAQVTADHARSAADREATRRAGIALRSAFASDIAFLRSTEGFTSSTEEIRERLYRSLVNSHASELEKFRFFVSSSDGEAYSEACEKYEELLHPGFMISTGEEQPSEYFINHINELLKYTKT